MNGKTVESRIYETPKTYDAVKCLCYEAMALGLKSVQVFPCMISLCREVLKDSGVEINALINYPHGGFLTEQKIAEAQEAVELGASAVEVMNNTRAVKRHDYEYVYREMESMKRSLPSDVTVKFIIETEYLTEEEMKETAKTAAKAGIDYLSTSTGLYHALDANRNDVELTASPEEVKLLKEASEGKVKIQAVGYISTPEIAESLLAAGADMISTEYAAAVMK
ncbi:MAG: deoxyribose-phosphate aldolase [Eubacteriales bacterium]|nr:deoxyribose-phosphate aldolase [Eubacteriales bacterium]